MDKKRKILKIIHKLQNSYPDHAVPHEDIVKKCNFDPNPTLLWLHAEDYISRYNTAGTITYTICPKGEDCLAERKIKDKDSYFQHFHDLAITIIGVLLGNADRIWSFISDLINSLSIE